MAAATPDPGETEKKPVHKTIELQLRWMESEKKAEPPLAPSQTPALPVTPSTMGGFLDPAYDRLETAPLFWEWKKGKALEIPFRDPVELEAALEFAYVLEGPAAVERLVQQVDVAAIRALVRKPEDPAFPSPGDLVVVPNDLDRDHSGLWGRLSRQMGFILPDSLSGPAAWTNDIVVQLTPPTYQRLLLMASDALTSALGTLWEKSWECLRRVETAAQGLLLMTLESARNEILREALRYFDFQDQKGVEAALVSYKSPMAKAEDDATARKASDVAKMPVHRLPARLQAALKELKPLAEDLIKKRKEAAAEKEKNDIGMALRLVRVNPAAAAGKAAEAEAAEQALANELGKLKESHPVALRLTPEELVKAPGAARDQLGAMLFPILARAYQANKNVRETVQGWPAAVMALDPRTAWPETALARRLKQNTEGSVWRHRKYVERAISRVFPHEGGLGSAAAAQALDNLHGESRIAELVSTLVRDVVVFEAASVVDRGVAAKAAAAATEGAIRKLPRLVPLVNWAYAGHAIYKDVSEYMENKDFFFCTLDPTDALAELEPRLGSLLAGVGAEIAFALV